MRDKTKTNGRGDGERQESPYCGWKWEKVQPLWKTVWPFLKMLKTNLLYDPAMPLPVSYLSKRNKNICPTQSLTHERSHSLNWHYSQ